MTKKLRILFLLLIALLATGAEAGAFSYQEDQAIDEKLGLLNQPFQISMPRLYTRQNLPAQMKPGSPPFSQQIQKSADPFSQGLDQICTEVIPGTVFPPTPARTVRTC